MFIHLEKLHILHRLLILFKLHSLLLILCLYQSYCLKCHLLIIHLAVSSISGCRYREVCSCWIKTDSNSIQYRSDQRILMGNTLLNPIDSLYVPYRVSFWPLLLPTNWVNFVQNLRALQSSILIKKDEHLKYY